MVGGCVGAFDLFIGLEGKRRRRSEKKTGSDSRRVVRPCENRPSPACVCVCVCASARVHAQSPAWATPALADADTNTAAEKRPKIGWEASKTARPPSKSSSSTLSLRHTTFIGRLSYNLFISHGGTVSRWNVLDLKRLAAGLIAKDVTRKKNIS